MLEVRNVKVYDLEESVVACRNAMRTELPRYSQEDWEKGLERAKKLCRASAESVDVKCHDNFLTGIRVSFDLIYPSYISPELQRYHFLDIVTSASKMHMLLKLDIDRCCNKYVSRAVINQVEYDIKVWNSISEADWEEGTVMPFSLRDGSVIEAKTKGDALYYAFMICLSDCPLGLELFMRVSTNYKQLQTIYHQRKDHKLKEDWGAFCDFVRTLPYASDFITME